MNYAEFVKKIEKMRLFQKAATGIFVFFLGVMAFVTVTAYSRKSGKTSLTMAKIEKLRQQKTDQP